MTLDGSTTEGEHRLRGGDPDAGDGRAARWIEFGWQPLGEPPADDQSGATRRWRVPELYVADHRAARILTTLLAIAVAAGAVFWGREAAERFDVPSIVCAGCAPPSWFRWALLFVAVAGIAAAVVQIVYFVNFAVRGIVWRRWRGVTIVFGTLAGLWTLMWWVDHLWL